MRRALALVLAACASEPSPDAPVDRDVDDVAAPTCDTSAQRIGVVTSFRFVRPDDDGRVEGFDLDGLTTGAGDRDAGCGVADAVAPDGREGIDNAFVQVLPALENTEAVAMEQIIQDAVNAGNLLVLLQLDALDDPVTDDCARLTILQGAGQPVVGAPGFINPGQTFDIDPAKPVAEIGDVEVVDGTLEGRPFDVTFPVEILGTPLSLALKDAAVRVHLQADGGFSGVLAGGVEIAEMLEIASTENVNPVVVQLLQGLVGRLADLAPDDTGACTRLSIGLAFEGVRAFLFDAPPADTGHTDW